jgi:DNA-directed RNA polymerase beta' subunit
MTTKPAHFNITPSKIIGIQFSLLSPDDIRKGSVVHVTSTDNYINNKPAIGGLFDPRMGVLEPGLVCPTDYLSYIHTPGYFGHIELARPVFYIQYINHVRKILECVCFKCSSLLIDKNKYKYILDLDPKERAHVIHEACSKITYCGKENGGGCGCFKPKISKPDYDTILAEWTSLAGTTNDKGSKDEYLTIKITAEIALKIIKRVTDEDIVYLGYSPIFSRPEWMICQVLAVPPPAVRPSVKHDSQQRSEDDITHILMNILKNNKKIAEEIEKGASGKTIDQWTAVLQYYVATLVNNKISSVAPVTQRSGRNFKSIMERLSQKTGRVRGNLMGKRVDFSARSVISPDPNLGIRQLGVPKKIAMNITYPETVNERNIEFLYMLVRNGPDVYPGAKIVEKPNGEMISLRYFNRNEIKLENGFKVHRHMLDGDPVLFNRQPTLHRMSMMCFFTRVMEEGNTFRMNLASCKMFNADFDGDEMNMHMPQDEEARRELSELALNAKHTISPANNSAIINLFQDSLLGAYQFTRAGIKFTPQQAMHLLGFSDIINPELFSGKSKITNFEIISQILPPLSMEMRNKMFNPDKPDDNHVVEIVNGKMLRGQTDSSIYASTSAGIIQSIHTDFGFRASAQFIDAIQLIVTEYMKQTAFSVGVSDLIADANTKEKIIQSITQKKQQAKNIIDKVLTGTFENTTGKTNVEQFETEVNAILNKAQDEAGKIGRENLSKNNRFVIMVNAGSKGKPLNIAQMISCLGQQNVDGKRIPYGFENRTLPHYTKYDDGPQARGFVENSFVGGLTPQEMFFHAMGGRVGLIDTAVKSVSWETPIIIIENNVPKYVFIGEWIDRLMKNSSDVKYETPLNMELLDIEENKVIIPTMDYHGNVSWKPVTSITRHDSGDKLYKITTNSGRSVIVTASKSLLVWNKELCEFKEDYTENIKIGDGIPTTLYLPSINEINEINMSDYLPKSEYIYGTDLHKAIELMNEAIKFKNKIPSGWWTLMNGKEFILPYDSKAKLQRSITRSNISRLREHHVYPFVSKIVCPHIPDKFELSYENGIFIGLFIAEGDVSKSQIRITNNDERIIEFVKEWFMKYNIATSTTAHINKIGGLTTVTKGSSIVIANFIKKIIGHKAENKNIPDFAYTANIEFVKGIINGYFSGDGHISKNSINCSTASKRLIYDIAYLCSRLGIFTKITVSQLKKNNFGTLNIKKSYRLSIINTYGRIFSENIRLIHPDKNVKMNNIVWSNKKIVESHNNVIIDPIVSIEDVPVCDHPKMYDLTIPETFNFGLANGLQVRDTASTGYIQRKLVKGLEDLKVEYDMTVRNHKYKVVQFRYGDDGFDAMKIETQKLPLMKMTVEQIYQHFAIRPEDVSTVYKMIFTDETLKRINHEEYTSKIKQIINEFIDIRSDLLRNVFGETSAEIPEKFNTPVHFRRITHTIKHQFHITNHSMVDITPDEAFSIIDRTYQRLMSLHHAEPNPLFRLFYYYYLSPKYIIVKERFNKKALLYLMEMVVVQYKKAIVHPGEMVGIVAAQSIGEPTTQLSLLRTERVKIIQKHKTTSNISVIADEIGTFCDKFIHDYPELTFNTGHKDSVETIIEDAEHEYYIPSVSSDEKVQWTRISHVSRHIVNGDMVRVKTRSGREVHTTLAHSHLIRDITSQSVKPIIANDLTIGMRIPITNFTPNEYINDTININGTSYELDYLFGWFIGAYLSEGNIIKKKGKYEATGTITITNINDIYETNVKKFAERFNRKIYVSFKSNKILNSSKTYTSKSISFTYKPLADVILKYCETGSFIKTVPSFGYSAPLEFKAGLLQGYFDGDGNINIDSKHQQIRACSRSKQLINDLALLLTYFNIHANLSTTYRCGANYYNISISSKYATLYAKHIGSEIHKSKLEKLNTYVNREVKYSLSDDIDRINGLGHIIAKCGKILKLKGQSSLYGRWIKKEEQNIPIGRRTLNKYIQIFEENDKDNKLTDEIKVLKQAGYSNIIWDEIVEIEKYTPSQTEYVYDFTVPLHQTFMTDYGIFVHNTLNTFHSAGNSANSNATRGVPRIEEIMTLTENQKSSTTVIFMKPDEEQNQSRAKYIQHMVENTILRDIVNKISIHYDPDSMKSVIETDIPLMSQYSEFEKLMEDCGAEGEDVKLSKWILRIEFNKAEMLERNVTMEDIHYAIQSSYQSSLKCIFSDYNADNLVMRIHLTIPDIQSKKNDKTKTNAQQIGYNALAPIDTSDDIYTLKTIQENLLNNIVLKGVKGIKKVNLRNLKNKMIETEGEFKETNVWVLDTMGTNLMKILSMDEIDSTRTYSNNIREMYKVLGIEATRASIYNEFNEVMEFGGTYINYHHLSMLVDRMTIKAGLVAIFRHDLNNDDLGPIAKASFEETPEMFLNASRYAELDTMRGISANIMCGQEGYFGTSSFQLVLDIADPKIQHMSEKKYEEQKDLEDMFELDNPNEKCAVQNIKIPTTNITTIQTKDMGKEDTNYILDF